MDHMGRDRESFTEKLARQALEGLQFHWGEAYEIGVIDGAWTARRRDGLGAPVEAAGPEDLETAILRDYSLRPVPRDGGPQ